MNRTASIHPLSLVLGLVLGVLCLITMAQTTVSTPLRVEYLAHPRDMVQIHQGTPFTVPVGKVLVLTALGTDHAGGPFDMASLSVDGVQEARVSAWVNNSVVPSSVVQVPPGRSVAAGSVVTVSANNPNLAARAWGYLADAAGTVDESAPLRVPYHPHPRDMVQIAEGSPYVVPSGKVFALTALGSTAAGNSSAFAEHALKVNGQFELIAQDPGPFTLPPLAEVPDGFTVGAGSTIEVVISGGSSSPGRAWGYLVTL